MRSILNAPHSKLSLFSQLFIGSGTANANITKTVYQLQIFQAKAHHKYYNISPYGLSEVHMLISGAELVMGFPLTDAETLADFSNRIKGMTGVTIGSVGGHPIGVNVPAFPHSPTLPLRWSSSQS